MLTKEQNDLLTQVGPGTSMGELLRRYWQPLAPAQELTDEHPTRFVRILGEDLVLFRDKSGRYGAIQDHCAHRGASLLYGRVEERGIAYAYHGWLYDTAGNCLECPAEPAGSKFHLTVRATAYPIQEFLGVLWIYMGPQPAPVIPPYDFLRRTGRIPRQRANDREYRVTRPGFEIANQPTDLRGFIRFSSQEMPTAANNYRGDNRTRYASPEFDALLERFMVTIPRPERIEILRQMIHHMTDRLVVLDLHYSGDVAASARRIQNVFPGDPLNAHEWDITG
jgi:nitrite reductase/ring-hydroxylating ferredoxin subunit